MIMMYYTLMGNQIWLLFRMTVARQKEFKGMFLTPSSTKTPLERVLWKTMNHLCFFLRMAPPLTTLPGACVPGHTLVTMSPCDMTSDDWTCLSHFSHSYDQCHRYGVWMQQGPLGFLQNTHEFHTVGQNAVWPDIRSNLDVKWCYDSGWGLIRCVLLNII